MTKAADLSKTGSLVNSSGQIDLTTGVTGTLPVANGGSGITSFGTGVATALGVNVGSAGAFVTNGGALGTPSSGNLANCTFPTLNQSTTGSSGSLATTNWTISESGGKLYFAYGGVNKGSLDSSGNFIVTGNVTAYGTP